MFTGIIEHKGLIKKKTASCLHVETDARLVRQLSIGASIAVDGACLTVTGISSKTVFAVNVMPETLQRTILGKLKQNSPVNPVREPTHDIERCACNREMDSEASPEVFSNGVNLELPLKVGGRFGGHVVQGHIDGTATIKSIQKKGNSYIFSFTAPAKLLRYMVEKGFVAINGISLTLINVTKRGFSVGVIPHTRKNTTFAKVKAEDAVNVEVDLFAKYISKFINR